ncbi:diguanylate cyclase [Shewanella sp. 10N.286.45.A1]|uniref:sensor domain-containing diguanylate cyclase n=1 Tax=Shewanella sp. 10N.286.45.A1 TaxID=3229694 RepID=UPI00355175B1
MLRLRISQLICLFYLLLIGNALAVAAPLPVIELASGFEKTATADQYQYLDDPSLALHIDDVVRSQQWLSPEPGVTNRGYSNALSWMRFSIKNNSSTSMPLVLEYIESSVQTLDLYYRDVSVQNAFSRSTFNFSAAVNDRAVSFYRPAFNIEINAGQEIEVYIRLMQGTDFPMHSFTAFNIWQEQQFYRASHIEIALLVALFCTEIFMGLATLVVYLATRDRTFLYYSLFAISVTSLFAGLSGVWGYFIAVDGYKLWMVVLQISVCQLAALIFVRSFLNIRLHSVWVDNAVWLLILLSLIGIVTNLGGYPYYSRLFIDNIALMYIFFIPIGLYCWYKKVPHALLFTCSWVVFILGMLLASMRLKGIIVDSFWAQWLIYIGGFIEAILLLSVLVLRLRDLQREKIDIELTHRTHLATAARELSDKVEKQTQLLRIAKEKAEYEARVDILTGLTNRRAFMEQTEVIAKQTKAGVISKMHCLMLDIDYFKKVNDQYGHAGGDRVLVEVASLLKGIVRETDIVARLGGEEFAVVTLDHDVMEAYQLAERIRLAIGHYQLMFEQQLVRLTISIGVASWRAGDEIENMIQRADMALYKAKNSGRNQVILYDGDNHQPQITQGYFLDAR